MWQYLVGFQSTVGVPLDLASDKFHHFYRAVKCLLAGSFTSWRLISSGNWSPSAYLVKLLGE